MNATAFPPSDQLPAPGFAGSATRPPPEKFRLSRNATIAIAVVVLHVAFIWALQSGLLMRAAEVIVPAEILTQFVDPPAPKVEPTPPAPPTPPVPVKKPVAKAPVQAAPQPLAVVDNTPAPASVNVPAPPLPPAPVAAPVAAAPVAPAGPPVVQLPSSDADYLNNPKPRYPTISTQLGEKGRTVVRVLIGTDGLPQKAEISQSSNFDRLDRAAIAAVMRWRFVPGKRNGVAEAMWFNVPIDWVLE